jgi:hypothetical protein
VQCDHKKKDGVRICGNCRADLTLSQEEIDERDKFYPLFLKSLKKESIADSHSCRHLLDIFVSQNALTLTRKMATTCIEVMGGQCSDPKSDLRRRIEKLEAELGEIKKLV